MMITVAAAYIEKNGKILLAERAKGELEGRWEFPGGKIEKGELSSQTVVREIREELGVDIIVNKKMGEFVHNYDFAQIKMDLFKCVLKDVTQEITLDGSHLGFCWVNLQKALKLNLTPMDRNTVNILINRNSKKV